jgi:hypothetical protein
MQLRANDHVARPASRQGICRDAIDFTHNITGLVFNAESEVWK